MAICKFAAIISGIRGSLGGLTFSANGAADYVKSWSMPSNPRSEAQNLPRATTALLPSEWRALSDAQRAAWDTWAALAPQARTNSLGDTYYPSGFNQFSLINTRILQFAGSIRSTPPTNSVPSAPTLTALNAYTGASNNSEITFSGSPFGALDAIVTGAIHTGDGLLSHSYRQLIVTRDDTNPTSPWDIQSELEDLFGQLSVGQKLYIAVAVQTSDGQRSTFTQLSDSVTVS